MRSIMIIIFLIYGSGCASTKNTAKKSVELNGIWLPVEQEFGGRKLPDAAFKNQKLVLADSIYTVTAESIDKGIVRYNNEKMDIYGKEGVNSGKHFTALYKLENGLLTICYDLAGKDYPQEFNTKGKPMYFLSVFKKE